MDNIERGHVEISFPPVDIAILQLRFMRNIGQGQELKSRCRWRCARLLVTDDVSIEPSLLPKMITMKEGTFKAGWLRHVGFCPSKSSTYLRFTKTGKNKDNYLELPDIGRTFIETRSISILGSTKS